MPNLFQPGDRCGAYQIIRFLGAGACAEVYEVVDHRGQRFALKVIATDEGIASKLHARIAQEGEALGLIAHSNVVRFHDAGVWGDRVWLLLELVDGVPLHAKLRDCLPPLDKAVYWLIQACEGVAEAHRAGVIHRDLKPSNILITAADQAKVIDFSLAKMRAWGVKTTDEQRVGTAMFMAPEQARGQPADPRMDVYAMGLVLYTAIAGRHPMGTRPRVMIEIVRWQLEGQPPPLRTLAPEVPGDLEALVHRALEKDPARRLQSMRELADGLRDVLLRMQVAQRKAALNVPIPNREHALAPTKPVPVFETAEHAHRTARAQLVAPVVAREPLLPAGGEVSAHRAAVPSPEGSRTLVSAEPAAQPQSLAIGDIHRQSAPSAPGDRRSTGIPVESSARPSRLPRKAPLAAVGATVALLGAATAWTLFGRPPSRAPAAPVSSAMPVAAATASPATAAPRASAAPSASASAAPGAMPSAPTAPKVQPRRASPPAPVPAPARAPQHKPPFEVPAKNRLFGTEN